MYVSSSLQQDHAKVIVVDLWFARKMMNLSSLVLRLMVSLLLRIRATMTNTLRSMQVLLITGTGFVHSLASNTHSGHT